MKEGKKKKLAKKKYTVCEHFLNTSFGIKQKIFVFEKTGSATTRDHLHKTLL